jgi:hypothetical protein
VPAPRPLTGGSRAIAVVAGASGRSVSGALTGRSLPFGLTAMLPGATFTGLRVGDESLRDAELSKYDTLILLGLCRLDLLDADERDAVRAFVASGGKLVLRDSNDASTCPSDDRDYRLLGLGLFTTAPPDGNAAGPVRLVADGPLGSSLPGSPYYLDTQALSTAPYSAADAGYLVDGGGGAMCPSLVVELGEARRVVRGWTNLGSGTVVFDGWDSGDGLKTNAPLAQRLFELAIASSWPLPDTCPTLPPVVPSATTTATPTRTPTPTLGHPTPTLTATQRPPSRTRTPGATPPTGTPRPTNTPRPTSPTPTATPTLRPEPPPPPSAGGPDPFGYSYRDDRHPASTLAG